MKPARKRLADVDSALMAELSKRELEERIAREKGDLAAEVHAVRAQAIVHELAGRHEEARRVLDRVVERCRTASDERAEARARCARGALMSGVEEHRHGEGSLEDLAFALGVYERIGDRSGLATAFEARATLQHRWDWLEEARADQVRATAIRRELGPPDALVESLRLLAEIEFSRHEWPGADAALSEAERIHSSSDLPPSSQVLLQVCRMRLSVEQGQWLRAMGLLVRLTRDAAKRMAATGMTLGLARAIFNRRQSKWGRSLAKDDLSLDDPIIRGLLPPDVVRVLDSDDDEKPS